MKILIIKLGAKGDVVRTLPLLLAIKKKYPDSEITWITKKQCVEIIETSPYIDKIFSFPINTNEKFDVLYNFDIDSEAAKLAGEIKADKKYGFVLDKGYPTALNFPSEYYLNTFFDDELKISNKKTYQQIMFEVAELPYRKQHCQIYLTDQDKQYAKDFVAQNKINSAKLIGLNIGSSKRWPSKQWHKKRIKEFIIKANEKGHEVLLLGGPDEIEDHKKILKELEEQGIKIYRNNPLNSDRQFAALIDICKEIISGDTFAMHVALAMKKPTIGLFFCTSPNEVEDYNLLIKIVSPKLYEFFPEKSDQYSEDLTKSISAEEVLNSLRIDRTVEVVNAIIKNSQNKFLVIKRKDEGIHPNKWAFPGGIIEEGEDLEQALKREIKEEVGLEVKKIIKKISEYNYQREDNSKTKGECFLIETENSDVKINNEVQDFKWVSFEEFEELDYVKGLDEELLTAFSELQNK